jgi:hypothetical protein
MRKMILAMLLLALALGGATVLDQAGLEASLWLVAIVGGVGGLLGGVAGGLLQQARG